MTDTIAESERTPARRSAYRPIMIGVGAFLAAAVAGFLLGRQGNFPTLGVIGAVLPGAGPAAGQLDIAFVKLPPLLVNLGDAAGAHILRFQAQLEVDNAHVADVSGLVPRVVDVLNTYLRAVDLHVLQDRSALVRLRAQMLRRVQLVVGVGMVRDLLVSEFVVN